MSEHSKPHDEVDFEPQEPNLDKPAMVCSGGWYAPRESFESIAPGITEIMEHLAVKNAHE